MTFAEEVFNLLANARTQAGGALPRDRWLAVVQDAFVKAKPAARPKRKPVSQMTDEEWIAHLEKEPTLAGVDVRRELGRAQFWCNENGRKCSRRFFINWLGNAERTLTSTGAGRTSRLQVAADINIEPAGWQAVAVRLYNQFAADQFKAQGWKRIDPHYRKEMVKALL